MQFRVWTKLSCVPQLEAGLLLLRAIGGGALDLEGKDGSIERHHPSVFKGELHTSRVLGVGGEGFFSTQDASTAVIPQENP